MKLLLWALAEIPFKGVIKLFFYFYMFLAQGTQRRDWRDFSGGVERLWAVLWRRRQDCWFSAAVWSTMFVFPYCNILLWNWRSHDQGSSSFDGWSELCEWGVKKTQLKTEKKHGNRFHFLNVCLFRSHTCHLHDNFRDSSPTIIKCSRFKKLFVFFFLACIAAICLLCEMVPLCVWSTGILWFHPCHGDKQLKGSYYASPGFPLFISVLYSLCACTPSPKGQSTCQRE